MPASAAVWPDPLRRVLTSFLSRQCHVAFLPWVAADRLNSLYLPSPLSHPLARFTHSIPIGARSGLLEHTVSAMLRPSSRPIPNLCRRSTADTVLMCYQQYPERNVTDFGPALEELLVSRQNQARSSALICCRRYARKVPVQGGTRILIVLLDNLGSSDYIPRCSRRRWLAGGQTT